MNLKDEMVAIINEILSPTLDQIYKAGPAVYICSTIFVAIGFIVVFAYIVLYPFMKFMGWTTNGENK